MNSFIKEQLQKQIKQKQEEYKAVSIQISEAIDLEQKTKLDRKLKRIEEELLELESKLTGDKPSKSKNESTPTQITINNSGSMSGINIGSGSQTIQKHSGTGDNAAISFAKGLYNGLGEGKSFEDAYNDAMITLLTENKDYANVIEVWKDGKKLDL